MDPKKKPEVGSAAPVEYLRVAKAAEFLGISEVQLWRWVKSGKVPAPRRLGKKVCIFSVRELRAVAEGAPRSSGPAIPLEKKRA